MPAPDSSAIDNALLAYLGSDPELLALCPNGVYWDEAPADGLTTRYVIVHLIEAVDVDEFNGRAYEDVLYEVSARIMTTVGVDTARAAAERIEALLQDQPLTAAGFVWMATAREGRRREIVPDERNAAIRWFLRGGFYRVQMAIEAGTRRRAPTPGRSGIELTGKDG
jgi:hypothetical protein